MNGVEDVYRTQAEGKDEISFAIVLDRLYDYEVIEQIFPGMLSIRLFQDAYYTAEKRAPEQKVYYLRTEGMEQDEEFRSLLVKYRAESPAQVKTCLLYTSSRNAWSWARPGLFRFPPGGPL